MHSSKANDLEDQSTNKSAKRGSPSWIFQAFFRRSFRDYAWILILAFWLVAFILGYVGLTKVAAAQGDRPSHLDLIYLLLQLVMLESGSVQGLVPWELEVARFALPALAAYTAIQALAILFRDQTQALRLLFIRDHVVICGISRKGILLARTLLTQNYQVVLIELDENHDQIASLREAGAILVLGDAMDPAVLVRASVPKAKFLIAVCEDDGTNAEIAVQSQNLLTNLNRDPLTCFIHIVDPALCDLLRENEIEGKRFPALRLELFNVFERGAHLMLEEFPPFDLHRDQNQVPHVLIIGLGKMGESLVTRAAHMWHLNEESQSAKLRMTVIDLEAEEKLKSLQVRFPYLEKCCHFSAHSMDVNCSDFHAAEFLSESELPEVNKVFVCFDSDSLGLNTGLALVRATKGQEIPIVVRMTEDRGLALLLDGHSEYQRAYSNLMAFALLNKTCSPELLFGGVNESLARSVHEGYLREQKDLEQSRAAKELLVHWDQLPENLKESNRRYADHISEKIQAVDCTLAPLRDWDAINFGFASAELERMAQMEHDRWLRVRKREGWIFAQERDDGKKRHPSLVPWDDLPEDEKEKNRAFIRDFPRVLARAGFQIQRNQ